MFDAKTKQFDFADEILAAKNWLRQRAGLVSHEKQPVLCARLFLIFFENENF